MQGRQWRSTSWQHHHCYDCLPCLQKALSWLHLPHLDALECQLHDTVPQQAQLVHEQMLGAVSFGETCPAVKVEKGWQA